MNDSWVTLQGWVGGEVTSREANGTPVATFRLGCTPRFIRNGVWVDGQTSWYTVTAWRALATNVTESVRKGQPVVVHGRMRADVWEREGLPTSVTHVVDATFVGHDLNRGTSSFERPVRPEREAEGVPKPAEPEASAA